MTRTCLTQHDCHPQYRDSFDHCTIATLGTLLIMFHQEIACVVCSLIVWKRLLLHYSQKKKIQYHPLLKSLDKTMQIHGSTETPELGDNCCKTTDFEVSLTDDAAGTYSSPSVESCNYKYLQRFFQKPFNILLCCRIKFQFLLGIVKLYCCQCLRQIDKNVCCYSISSTWGYLNQRICFFQLNTQIQRRCLNQTNHTRMCITSIYHQNYLSIVYNF